MDTRDVETRGLSWSAGGGTCRGHLARPAGQDPRPGVLVFPAWMGLSAAAKEEVEAVARQGWVALGVDVYGDGRVAKDAEEAAALMAPFAADRARLRARGRAALEALTGLADVDERRIAAVGFCFGGMAALELARTGADLRAAVSYHGFLDTPDPAGKDTILARILAHHGNDDPLAAPGAVDAFREEMTGAGADWTLIVYGNTMHGFTNPAANAPDKGIVYQPASDRTARRATEAFLRDCLADG